MRPKKSRNAGLARDPSVPGINRGPKEKILPELEDDEDEFNLSGASDIGDIDSDGSEGSVMEFLSEEISDEDEYGGIAYPSSVEEDGGQEEKSSLTPDHLQLLNGLKYDEKFKKLVDLFSHVEKGLTFVDAETEISFYGSLFEMFRDQECCSFPSVLKKFTNSLCSAIANLPSSPVLVNLLEMLDGFFGALNGFPQLRSLLIKALSSRWSLLSSDEEVNGACFANLELLLNMDQERVLKSAWNSFCQSLVLVSSRKNETINVLKSQLISLLVQADETLVYRIAFLSIRSMALQLNDHKTVKKVLTWQVLHAIDTWAEATAKKKGNMSLLSLPLLQICNGLLVQLRHPRNWPFAFRVIRIANQMMFSMNSEGTFVYRALLEMLRHLATKTFVPSKSVNNHVDWANTLKVPIDQSNTAWYAKEALAQVLALFSEILLMSCLKVYSCEVFRALSHKLRGISKATKNVDLSKSLKDIITAIEHHAQLVSELRVADALTPTASSAQLASEVLVKSPLHDICRRFMTNSFQIFNNQH